MRPHLRLVVSEGRLVIDKILVMNEEWQRIKPFYETTYNVSFKKNLNAKEIEFLCEKKKLLDLEFEEWKTERPELWERMLIRMGLAK